MASKVIKNSETISKEVINLISLRYHNITRAINREFWESSSDTNHSIYVGSYGRGTAIDDSDIDVLVELPRDEYYRFDSVNGNGQSRLLQVVKDTIVDSYPNSDIHADGQVVVINFSDGMKFEILPAFKSIWFGYEYPDTHMGGNWKSTNPRAEQEAIKYKNQDSNGLLYDTCKHIRRIHMDEFVSYDLSGILIDTFVYNAIGDWHWLRKDEKPSSSGKKYEYSLLEYYEQNKSMLTFCKAPGSNQEINSLSSIECLEKILKYMVD